MVPRLMKIEGRRLLAQRQVQARTRGEVCGKTSDRATIISLEPGEGAVNTMIVCYIHDFFYEPIMCRS